MNAEQEMSAWHAWHEACALALIPVPDRIQLTTVIADRFRSMVRRINLHGQGRLSAPNDADCAHLFETYCAMHNRRDGKKYKYWLLTRGRRDLDTVQSGVMLLVRNVVREWVRDAHPRTAAMSLQQTLGSNTTLEQLLPDTRSEQRSCEQREWLTQKLASDLSDLDPVERILLLLRAQGRVFSAPGIQAEFGVGKSTLHKYHRKLLEREAEELSGHFPGLSAEDACSLVLDLLDGWGKQLLSEFLAENTDVPAFKKAKEEYDA
jgi:hypothetical protein